MLIIPKEKPDIANLNSYYLDIRKLIEHYQGELGSGAIYLKGPGEEGAIFFDKEEILDGVLQDKGGEFGGKAAVKRLMDAAGDNSFVIDIYGIDPYNIYFWANVRGAKKIYKNLSTEFTDLEGLIKKMGAEKLTGYIDISINNGEVIGGSYSRGKGELNGSKESQKLLIEKTRKLGGVFHVSEISLTKGEEASEPIEIEVESSANVLTALEELLGIFESTISSKKKIKTDFNTLLRKKLVEKADKYVFLDPFAGEFIYSDRKITFSGDASDEDLVNALIESVEDLAGELGILPMLADRLAPWSQKYAKELDGFGINY
jgi:hypothetical protein